MRGGFGKKICKSNPKVAPECAFDRCGEITEPPVQRLKDVQRKSAKDSECQKYAISLKCRALAYTSKQSACLQEIIPDSVLQNPVTFRKLFFFGEKNL